MDEELIRQLAKCCGVPLVLPDIPDREEREKVLLTTVRKEFEKTGNVARCFIIRVMHPAPALLRIELNLTKELTMHAPQLGYAFAKGFRAKQLYHVSEMWWAVDTGDEVPPSERVDRHEGVMVGSEDSTRDPPMRMWSAMITRDATGKGTLGEWSDFKDIGGRLTYMLPPEAYEAKGRA